MSYETKVTDITELVPKILEQNRLNPILSELLYDRYMPVTVDGIVSCIIREDSNTILVMFSAKTIPNFEKITNADKMGEYYGGVTCYFSNDKKMEIATKLVMGEHAVIRGVICYSSLEARFRNIRVEQCSIIEPTSPYTYRKKG